MAWVLVGLGNPGEEYASTRHNTGRMALEYFAQANDFGDFREDKKMKAHVASGMVGKTAVVLVAPDTFMNKSGSALTKYVKSVKAAERMVQLAERFQYLGGNEGSGVAPLRVRALNQAARELLLAQHSDWAFIMKTGTMLEYAHRRTWTHLSRFNRLFQDLEADRLDPSWLEEMEARDNVFPRLDYRVYCP